jgi:PAS domain S-box-containing protein
LQGEADMSKIYFNLDQLGDDQTLLKNALEIALENNTYSVMLTRADAGYPILYVNPAFTKLTGYSFDEVAGKDPGILQGPKTHQKLLEDLRQKLEKGEIFHGKTVNYRKDGSEFIMEWKIYPIRNSEKQTTHFLAFQHAI